MSSSINATRIYNYETVNYYEKANKADKLNMIYLERNNHSIKKVNQQGLLRSTNLGAKVGN